MTLLVVGAGFGRNGTLSLKVALEKLGLGPCYHMQEVFRHPEHIPLWRAATRGESIDWSELLADYRSIVDWPGCTFWQIMARDNPAAKILLSHRDADAWHRSVCDTIYQGMTIEPPEGAPPFFHAFQEMAQALVIEHTFDGRILDAEHAKSVYRAHNDEVRRLTPPDRLIDWELGAGWDPLCKALDVPIPDEPFPRTNTTEEFQRRSGRTNA